jgi:dephospho-CoA kinase
VNDDERKALEAITHPAIGAAFLQRIADAPPGSIIVHDIPLLTEAKREGDYAAVIVVEAPLAVRLDRLESSRGVPRDDAERRIALQASDEERRAIATWVLDNGGDVGALESQLDRIWIELQELVRKAE